MTAPTTRPSGLGIGVASQICTCYDTGNANWNNAPAFMDQAKIDLHASWIHNWHWAKKANSWVPSTWPSQAPSNDWFYSSIFNLITEQGNAVRDQNNNVVLTDSHNYNVLVNEIMSSRRFYLLWNEPNNGVSGNGGSRTYDTSPEDTAASLTTWRWDTRKYVSGAWTYTKWAAPGLLINSEGNGGYGIGTGGGAREFMDRMIGELNSSQLPDTFNIHIYATSDDQLEDIWGEWKSWMNSAGVSRATIVGEFGHLGGTRQQNYEQISAIAFMLGSESTYLKAAAYYGVGVKFANPDHETSEIWDYSEVSGTCPDRESNSGRFSPTTGWLPLGDDYIFKTDGQLGQ